MVNIENSTLRTFKSRAAILPYTGSASSSPAALLPVFLHAQKARASGVLLGQHSPPTQKNPSEPVASRSIIGLQNCKLIHRW